MSIPRTISGIIFLSVIISCSNGKDLNTTQQEKTMYSIVVEKDCIESEITAANELKTHLEQVIGRPIAILSEVDQAPAGNHKIYVGQTQTVKKLLKGVDWGKLGQEGVIIKTIGNDLILSGGRPRGSLYAVYTFLEDYVGVRWWTYNETYIPQKPDLVIPAIDYQYVPPFWYRESVFRGTNAFDLLRIEEPNQDKGLFGVRLKLNGFWQGKFKDIAKYGGHFDVYGMYHTFHWYLLRPDIYFKNYPEWYSLVDGRRTDKGQLCLTNEQMTKKIIEVCLSKIKPEENKQAIAVSMVDTWGNCECPACKASDEKYGAPSGTLIAFLNKVADGINAVYPDMLITTLAYYYTSPPPTGIKPNDNIMVYYCAWGHDQYHPLNDGCNARWLDELQGWRKITKHLVVYEYYSCTNYVIFPLPNIPVIGENLKLYKNLGADGSLIETDSVVGDGDFLQLRGWLTAKLLWNPDLDTDALIKDFMVGNYGPAAEYLLAYQQLMRRYWLQYNSCVQRGQYSFEYVKLEMMNQAEELFNKAEEAVKNSPAFLANVKRERMPLRALWIERYYPLKREAQLGNMAFMGPSDIKEAVAAYKADMVHYDIRQVSFHQSIEELFGRWEDLANITPTSAKPIDYPDIQNKKWIDVQDDDFWLYKYGKHIRVVEDPTASDNRACYMKGDDYSWALQYRVKKAGQYRVLVSAKVEKISDAGKAFAAGIFDALAYKRPFETTVDISEVKGDGYQTYDLGVHFLSPSRYIWITPPKENTAVKSLYVDRIVLIEE